MISSPAWCSPDCHVPTPGTCWLRDNRDELTSLRREAGAIRELVASDRGLHLGGLLTGLEFAGGRRQYQADLAAVE